MELRRTNRLPQQRLSEPWDAVGFGLEVRRLRRLRRLTVRAVTAAIFAGKSTSSSWKLEQGFRGTVPTPAMLRSLAAVLGTTEAHLLRAAGYGVACGCGRCGPVVGRAEAARARIRAEVMGERDDEEEP